MTFAQLIEYTTSRPDEVKRLHQRWEEATAGTRHARRLLLMQHHDAPDRICELVVFDSHDDAVRNSQLQETDRFATELHDLVDGDITYIDLDIVEEKSL